MDQSKLEKYCISVRVTYLNWQKMSAYSGEIPDACRMVTRNVSCEPILRCSGKSSSSMLKKASARFSSSPGSPGVIMADSITIKGFPTRFRSKYECRNFSNKATI